MGNHFMSLLVFKIFEKAQKIKKILKNYNGSDSLVLEIARTKTNKTFMASKHNFKTQFVVI